MPKVQNGTRATFEAEWSVFDSKDFKRKRLEDQALKLNIQFLDVNAMNCSIEKTFVVPRQTGQHKS